MTETTLEQSRGGRLLLWGAPLGAAAGPTWISMWQMSTWPASAAACRGDRLLWCSILKLGSMPSTVNRRVLLVTSEPALPPSRDG